jgi:hypothetical protein
MSSRTSYNVGAEALALDGLASGAYRWPQPGDGKRAAADVPAAQTPERANAIDIPAVMLGTTPRTREVDAGVPLAVS